MTANLPPDAATDVTDEDVERACRTIWTPKDDLELQWDQWRGSHRARLRPFVRAALEDFASRRSPRAAAPDTEAMREAADELEAIYRQQYSDGKGGIHPALRHKFERDMDLVHRLRASRAAPPAGQEGSDA